MNDVHEGSPRVTSRILQVAAGFTLFELVITLTVLAILVMGTIPLAQNAVKRQKEVRLRETLRQIRGAIDEFKRDTIGACAAINVVAGNQTRPDFGGGSTIDPRSRVVIDDCAIFDTENLDRFPPDLETLVNGVRVKARGPNVTAGSGLGNTAQATELNQETNELKKVYLREMPIDPMTGESDWKLRSSYQEGGDDSWDQINVFDVRSASTDEALNGEKYSEW